MSNNPKMRDDPKFTRGKAFFMLLGTAGAGYTLHLMSLVSNGARGLGYVVILFLFLLYALLVAKTGHWD